MPARFDTAAEDEKLARLREAESEDLARVLSDKYGYAYTDLSIVPVDMEALRMIPERDAREAGIVAFERAGKRLSVAMRDPGAASVVPIEKALEAQGYSLTRHLVSSRSLAIAFARYAELSYASETHSGVADVRADELASLRSGAAGLPWLRAELDKALATGQRAQASRSLEILLAAAFALKASDIHLEPEERGVRLRLRLDGQLVDAYELDERAYRLLSSRLKLVSGLLLNVRDRAQDGRFTVPVGDTEVEVRASVIPGAYGESFVLRLLDPSALEVPFEALGMHPKLLARLSAEITRPNGMLLTTGPTGSGKTTSLYSFLKRIHTPDLKIVTIEDPIEYHLPGIVQTQVDGEGYTFASGLRSVLRQDPDVIMVGEIRDGEVAETALQAALTGHFVFSTLHTNNAAGTFPRLVDLGIDPKSFASAVSVAMGQRLVRTLDPEAREEVPATDEQKRLIDRVLSTVEDASLVPASSDRVWVPKPDPAKGGTGYRGRIGVYEAIFMDEELGAFLRDNPSEGEIAASVRRQGFLTMAQDGVLKALRGETSLDELQRAVDLPRT